MRDVFAGGLLLPQYCEDFRARDQFFQHMKKLIQRPFLIRGAPAGPMRKVGAAGSYLISTGGGS